MICIGVKLNGEPCKCKAKYENYCGFHRPDKSPPLTNSEIKKRYREKIGKEKNNEYHREYYQKNKERIKQISNNSYHKNKILKSNKKLEN